MNRLVWLFLFTACLVLCGRAFALSVIPPQFDELVQKADSILRTEVISSRCEWKGEGEKRRIVTKIKIRVESCLVGECPAEMEIEFLGGTIGERSLVVPGLPQFKAGDRDLLFVRNNGRSFCPLVAAGHGRYLIVASEKGDKQFIARADGTPLTQISDVSKSLAEVSAPERKIAESQVMSLESFEVEILAAASKLGRAPGRKIE